MGNTCQSLPIGKKVDDETCLLVCIYRCCRQLYLQDFALTIEPLATSRMDTKGVVSPKIEKCSYMTPSSTSSPIPPMKTVFFDLEPSSMRRGEISTATAGRVSGRWFNETLVQT